jgi:hypothetical protein
MLATTATVMKRSAEERLTKNWVIALLEVPKSLHPRPQIVAKSRGRVRPRSRGTSYLFQAVRVAMSSTATEGSTRSR